MSTPNTDQGSPSGISAGSDAFNEILSESMVSEPSSEPTEPAESLDPAEAVSDTDVESQETQEADAPDMPDQDTSADAENADEGLSENIEEITVKGKDGKRKNIKVDFSDKEKIKKYVQKAANASRLQSERDALTAQVQKLEESQKALDSLQETMDVDGIEGLLDKLLADNGGYQAWIDQKLERYEERQGASEEELKYLEEQEKREAIERRLRYMEERQELDKERAAQEREQAEIAKIESQVNPIFFKYAFDNKLGDSVLEQRYNQAMHKDVMSTLDSLEEKGVTITEKVIEREFAKFAKPLMKAINKKVKSNTAKHISNKKKNATSSAQHAARKGYSKNATEQEIEKAWASKNPVQALLHTLKK